MRRRSVRGLLFGGVLEDGREVHSGSGLGISLGLAVRVDNAKCRGQPCTMLQCLGLSDSPAFSPSPSILGMGLGLFM